MKKADRGNHSRSGRPLEASRSPASDGRETVRRPSGMPDSDPAAAIVSGILGLVPASRWTFARVEPNGELLSRFGSDACDPGLAGLADELGRQRSFAAAGPRIAATLGPLGDYASGVTLVFADARADFGILTLLRAAELGSFTSSEISMLVFALDAGSDRLSALRLQPPALESLATGNGGEPGSATGAFYILDHELHIVLAWSSQERRHVALTGLPTRVAERLPRVLEDTVRHLTSGWAAGPEKASGVAQPVAFLVVRTHPMWGPAGLFIGVQIDRFLPPNSLTGAAARFHITPREVQVLALILDGNHLDRIAEQMHITSSTVQDHIKSMLDKTGSRNRSELIARVLGWEARGIRTL